MAHNYRYDGKENFNRKKFDTNDTGAFHSRKEVEAKFKKNLGKINELQQRLYSERSTGVIFLFQAMDAAGKDGTIRAVLSCLSPHGVSECAFKAPSSEELAHGFLWRIEKCVPAKGHIAIFNRSHYEDVLIGRVHKLYENQAKADYLKNHDIIKNRYEDICNFEKYLYNNSVRTVKIFLNVSKDEQAKRFLSRIEEPEKNWKFSEGDVKERSYWEDYQEAFEDAINATATEDCPWYVVPADHKWYMRYVVSQIILDTLKEINPKFPELSPEEAAKLQSYHAALEKTLPKKERESAPQAAPKAKKAARRATAKKSDSPKSASKLPATAAKSTDQSAAPRKPGRPPKASQLPKTSKLPQAAKTESETE